jgi:putative tricarboxylic transport membrane protein
LARSNPTVETYTVAETSHSANISRREIAIAVFLTAFGFLVIALSGKIESGVYTDPLGPRVFPYALGVGIAVCGLLLGIAALFPWQSEQAGFLSDPGGAEDVDRGPFSAARLLGAVGATGLYVAAFEPAGYVISTPLYVIAILVIHGGIPWRTLVVAPLIITTVLYVTFRFALRIPVPGGLLERVF